MIADIISLLWDTVAFIWRHFFDILELLFVGAVLAVAVAIVVGATGAGRGALNPSDIWRRLRRVGASERPAQQPVARELWPDPRRVDPPGPHAPAGTAPHRRGVPSPSRARTTTAPSQTTTATPGDTRRQVLKCAAEKNKTVYATQAKADAKVAQSKQRYALHGGQLPLDHSYRCPHGYHWHVSSKPRY